MKLPSLIVSSLLIAAAGLQACGHDASPSNVDAADSSGHAPGLEAKAKEAVAKGKEEWKKFTETQVPEIDKRIAELKDKVAKSSATAKVELDKLVHDIGEKRKELESKLGELKTASAEQLQHAKGEISEKAADLKKSIDQALEKTK